MDSKDLKELSALYLDSVYLNEKDTPDQVKAVIAYDKARKGTEDAVYDTEHGKKKQAKKERDYAKWQRDKGAEDAQKSGHPWEHAKGSTREKEGKKSEKHAHIKDSFEPLTVEKKRQIKNQAERRKKSADRAQMASDYEKSTKQDQQVRNMKRVSEEEIKIINALIESGKFNEHEIQNITEILGAALGGIAGHTMLAPALAKAGAAGALTKAGLAPGVAKALTGKTASAALGSAAGEVLAPTKKQKDKNPVSAAAGGAAGSATAGALGLGASYQPKGESLSEFKWDPEGARKAREALPKKDHTIWKPGVDLGLSKDVDITKDPVGAVAQIAKDKIPTAAKAGLVGAAALGTKAAVDTVMGHGKNSNGKNSNEEFEFANKLIESGLFSEEEIKIILWNEGYQRNPEKGEAEERKAEKSRKESGRMPPRGDKRREDFEKWYAANVK